MPPPSDGPLLDDAFFDAMATDVFWEGEIDLPPFGDGIRVEIEPDDEADDPPPPTLAQRQALRVFVANAAARHEAVESESVAYYRDIADEYRDFWGEQAGEKVPELGEPADIWRLLSGPYSLHVGIDYGDGDPVPVTVGYGCTWDEEHGHYVRFEGERVASVGPL